MTLIDAAWSATRSDRIWELEILPALEEYIRIPNRSPAFDTEWQQAGHMDRAVNLIADWCKQQPLAGLVVEVVRLPGRTPLIYMEVPGDRPRIPCSCIRPPRQAARDDRLARWPRSVAPGAAGR